MSQWTFFQGGSIEFGCGSCRLLLRLVPKIIWPRFFRRRLIHGGRSHGGRRRIAAGPTLSSLSRNFSIVGRQQQLSLAFRYYAPCFRAHHPEKEGMLRHLIFSTAGPGKVDHGVSETFRRRFSSFCPSCFVRRCSILCSSPWHAGEVRNNLSVAGHARRLATAFPYYFFNNGRAVEACWNGTKDTIE